MLRALDQNRLAGGLSERNSLKALTPWTLFPDLLLRICCVSGHPELRWPSCVRRVVWRSTEHHDTSARYDECGWVRCFVRFVPADPIQVCRV